MENMRLILWTLVGAAAIWFVTMTVNRNIFNHSDIDRSLTGTIPISRTDIGDKCGAQYVNAANEFVQYKVTPTGRLVYLCPQGLWPIQTTVTAVTLSPDFRNSVSPTFRSKLDLFYPPAAAAQSNTNPFNTAPAPTTTQGVPAYLMHLFMQRLLLLPRLLRKILFFRARPSRVALKLQRQPPRHKM